MRLRDVFCLAYSLLVIIPVYQTTNSRQTLTKCHPKSIYLSEVVRQKELAVALGRLLERKNVHQNDLDRSDGEFFAGRPDSRMSKAFTRRPDSRMSKDVQPSLTLLSQIRFPLRPIQQTLDILTVIPKCHNCKQKGDQVHFIQMRC